MHSSSSGRRVLASCVDRANGRIAAGYGIHFPRDGCVAGSCDCWRELLRLRSCEASTFGNYGDVDRGGWSARGGRARVGAKIPCGVGGAHAMRIRSGSGQPGVVEGGGCWGSNLCEIRARGCRAAFYFVAGYGDIVGRSSPRKIDLAGGDCGRSQAPRGGRRRRVWRGRGRVVGAAPVIPRTKHREKKTAQENTGRRRFPRAGFTSFPFGRHFFALNRRRSAPQKRASPLEKKYHGFSWRWK